MAISKIILNGVTQMDVTGVSVQASNLIAPNTAIGADGEQVTGTATGGVDIPTFTVTVDPNTGTKSVTCDKTYAQCSDYINDGKSYGSLTEVWDASYSSYGTVVWFDQGSDYIYYTAMNGTFPAYDIRYNSDGTFTVIEPSVQNTVLNITENGTTYPIGIVTEVNVNVPQPSGSVTITSNGTHNVTNYASAVVNVPSSGASSWTKIAETSYQVSTTNTSAATVATWATGHSELWTSSKWVYVRVRDTAGKRAGYFYGSDQFLQFTGTGSSATTWGRFYSRYTTSGSFGPIATYGTTGYGVYADTLYSDGRIRIRQRYSSGNSLTIDGTYKVEVYLLDPPTGAPIFE